MYSPPSLGAINEAPPQKLIFFLFVGIILQDYLLLEVYFFLYTVVNDRGGEKGIRKMGIV